MPPVQHALSQPEPSASPILNILFEPFRPHAHSKPKLIPHQRDIAIKAFNLQQALLSFDNSVFPSLHNSSSEAQAELPQSAVEPDETA